MTKKTLMGRFHLAGIPKQGLCGSTLGFFIGFAAVSLYGPTAKLFKETMGLSPSLLGLLVSVPIFSGALLRIPLAALVDTTGGRKPFLALLILSFLGMLGLCFITAVFYPHKMNMELYPLLLLLGALCGCGVATFSVGAGQISYWYPKNKQGKALGIYAGVGNMAPGIFSFLFPVALFYLGLWLTYLVWVIFLAIGVTLYYLLGKNACYFQLVDQGIAKEEAKLIARKECKEEFFPEGTFKDSLLISAKARSTWGLALIYFTTFGGFLALVVWLPTYWQMFHSLTIEAASRLTALYAILASLIRILGGEISDRFTGEKTAVLSLYIMLAGSLLMTFSHNINISISGIVLMALGMGVTNAAVFKLVPEAIPHAVGGASGWVGGVGAFGGFAIVNAMAVFIKTENIGDPGYAQGFIIFSALALASIIAIRTIKYRQKS